MSKEIVNKIPKVNTRNDVEMVRLGLRVPPFELDYSFKIKDKKELAYLAKVKHPNGPRVSFFPEKTDGLIGNAVVFYKKKAVVCFKAPNNQNKTTVSESIYEYQLTDFINQFPKEQVSKVYFNGSLYKG